MIYLTLEYKEAGLYMPPVQFWIQLNAQWKKPGCLGFFSGVYYPAT